MRLRITNRYECANYESLRMYEIRKCYLLQLKSDFADLK